MRKALGLVGAALLFAGPALAADLSKPAYKAPPPPAAPITNWTGFYLDAGAGYGMWTADTNSLDPVTGVCFTCVPLRQGGRGWFGTIGGGYDFQFNNNIVIGALGSYDFASIKGTIQDQAAIVSGEEKMSSAWAAGARLGWLVAPSTLTYINGGWSGAHFDGTSMVSSITGAASGFATPAFSRTGWFLGSGVEYMLGFAPGWFARAEYRYADYGTTILRDTHGAAQLDSISFHPIVQTVRTELVYKFNWFK